MLKYIMLVTILVTLCSFIILRLILLPFDTEFEMKYILLWDNPNREPANEMIGGRSIFLRRKCPVSNCYFAHIKSVVRKISDFDAIMFHGPELDETPFILPTLRSTHQKYIYLSIESSVNYPIIFRKLRGVFNWTMTYKLNSDIYFGYIEIRNKTGHLIGPKPIMHWLNLEDMKPIDDAVKKKLQSKKYAAAWFVSNNRAVSRRREIALEIRKELALYNMSLDIYGNREKMKCPRARNSVCFSILERYYYFYLSFENTLSDDYVTEKLLTALQHYAVPVVYGGANYTRFMPDGSYLDVRTLGIKMLVKTMVAAIRNKTLYYDFFRWTNHYTYHSPFDSPETDPYCELCRRLNDADSMNKITIYEYFSAWWRSKACSDYDNTMLLRKSGLIEPLNFIPVKCSQY